MPREVYKHVLADGLLTKWEIVDITGIPVDLVELTLRDQEALGIVKHTDNGWVLCENQVRLTVRAYR